MGAKAVYAQFWCCGALLLACSLCNRLALSAWRGPLDPAVLHLIFAVVALGWLAWRGDVFDSLSRGRALAWWAGSSSAALMLVLTWRVQSGVIEGQRYWWLCDDAMVSMRYAKNLAHGAGLVWNPGQRVEGFSNLLWTLFMSLPHALGVPEAWASFSVLFAEALLLVWLSLATWRLSKALELGDFAASIAACLTVLSFDAVGVARTGMEALLVACLFTESLTGILGGGLWRIALGGTGLALARFDGIYLVALLAGAAWLVKAPSRSLVALGLPALVAAGAAEIWRLAYYREWVPNTVFLKGDPWTGRWQSGWDYAQTFFGARYPGISASAFLVLALPTRAIRLRVALALPVLGLAVYVIWAGGDFMPELRFFLPLLPLLATLAAALGEVTKKKLGAPAQAVLMLAVALSSASTPYFYPMLLDPANDGSPVRIRATLAARRAVPDGALLATGWAGLIPYFWPGPALDLLGKCDPWIARSKPHEEQPLVGHNKWDHAYALGRQPDVVHLELPDSFDELPYYTQRMIEEPLFRRACRGQVIFKEGSTTVFRCDWGKKKDPPLNGGSLSSGHGGT